MVATQTLMTFNNFDLLNTIIACAAIFATVYISNKRMRKELTDDNARKFEKKADIAYVDRNCESIHEQLHGKADKSLVESMDKKLDLILQKLK